MKSDRIGVLSFLYFPAIDFDTMSDGIFDPSTEPFNALQKDFRSQSAVSMTYRIYLVTDYYQLYIFSN